jgi:hypothetical protein
VQQNDGQDGNTPKNINGRHATRGVINGVINLQAGVLFERLRAIHLCCHSTTDSQDLSLQKATFEKYFSDMDDTPEMPGVEKSTWT